MHDVTLEPRYSMRSTGSRIAGWAFIAFAVILTIMIVIDGGIGDLPTGIGFIVGALAYGILMYMIPRLESDPRGITTVGPFTSYHVPWDEVGDLHTEWGLKIRKRDGTDIPVHAYPSTGGLIGSKDTSQSPEFFTTGSYDMLLAKRPAVSLMADQIHFYRETKTGQRRLVPSTYKKDVHYDRIVMAIIAVALFAANAYTIIW